MIVMTYVTGRIIRPDGSRAVGPTQVDCHQRYPDMQDVVERYERAHGKCASFEITMVH